ncbi:MAG: lipopolysaccharide assembly protein LapA domain-containing protein [Acidaminococcaceae bacterium]|nr:lipopolysaccharide assembly protein LapA domain-containing protein [Acidaminococcaceae bacterium]MDD4721211.1 lipopolysaccharide assembly protein LapA domain-containing protein [Acidaminococcaceae bacterium]
MIYVILMCIVSLGVALFAVQNSVAVAVTFLAWNFQTSLVMVILSSLIAGLFIALCWGLKLKAQHYLRDRKLQEQIVNLEDEKNKLQEKIEMLMYTQKQRLETKGKDQPAMVATTFKEAPKSENIPTFDSGK